MTAPGAATVHVEDGGDRVRTLVLNRPERLNAFDAATFAGVRDALERAAGDPGVGCVVLTGAGRAFSAGIDLGADAGPPGEEAAAFVEALVRFPKPLVAAVNGVAVGVGATLLAHCDLVLAAESARLRVPLVALGLVPEAASTVMLPAVMGPQAAAHALLGAGWISSAEALAAGLAWRRCPDDELLASAHAVAVEIAAQPLEALVATKRLLLEARLPAVRAALERERAEFAWLAAGPAHREALLAFRERRPPRLR